VDHFRGIRSTEGFGRAKLHKILCRFDASTVNRFESIVCIGETDAILCAIMVLHFVLSTAGHIGLSDPNLLVIYR